MMPEKKTETASGTLFVSDLDGTLMRSDQTISPFTADTINRMVDKGMLFSYATARSLHTASVITRGITVSIPVIIYNGAFIVDSVTHRVLFENVFSSEAKREIYRALLSAGVSPIVYSVVDGAERYSYLPNKVNPATRAFLLSRSQDVRDHPSVATEELMLGDVFYFTCIDSAERLEPLRRRFSEQYSCVYQRDIYSGEQWLEIMPREVSKASAVLRLKALTGARRVVAFGDGVNDLPMFEAADECYAVANADSRLKSVATDIIDVNDNDGVARWLRERIGIS